MKKYAVLHVPEFRLQSVLRYLPEVRKEEPAALMEVQGSKLRVGEVNAAAAACQVQLGMSSTQALARCPVLHMVAANLGHERSAQAALLQTAEVLSPFLESTGPGVVTIELPPERTFSTEDFLGRIVVPLQALGLQAKVGMAGTPDLALLAARRGNPVYIVRNAAAVLSPLPVSVLQPSEELAAVLESWGVRSVAQLVALPMTQVCERLGPEAVELWERARGGRVRPLDLVKPREFFVEEIDLENFVELLETLLFLLRRFLEQLTTRLGNAYLVAGKMRLVLRFEDGSSYQRVFTVPQPTCDVDVLFRILHTHLENFVSESPIVGLELAAKPVRPGAEQFDLLEKGVRDPHQLAETVGRLQALLGPERVGTPQGDASHHPDGFVLHPYEGVEFSDEFDESPLLGVPWLRFRPPVPANIVLNDKRPAFLYSSRTTGPVSDARGPWLLEGDWWESWNWSREEWDIATEDGVYRLVRDGSDWFLDGLYA